MNQRWTPSKAGRSSTGSENYLYLDPKIKVGSLQLPPSSRTPQKFRTCIVLVVGGGNYSEYLGLQEYSRGSAEGRQILYGATDIVSSDDFLLQMAQAG